MNKKVMFSSLLILCIMVSSSIIGLNGSKNIKTASAETKEYILSVPNKGVDFDANPYAKYRIVTPINDLKFIKNNITIVDNDNKKLDIRLQNNGDKYYLLPPKNGYKKGHIYTVTLHKGLTFVDYSNQIDIVVDRDNSELCKFEDKVVHLKENEFQLMGENKIYLNKKYNIGTIIVIPNQETFMKGYKIVSIHNDINGKYLATFVVPDENEILKEVDISNSYDINDGQLSINEGSLKDQLEKSIKDYADQAGNYLMDKWEEYKPVISFPDSRIDEETGIVYLNIKIKFKVYNKGEVDLLLENEIDIKPFLNIKLAPFNFSTGADMNIKTTTTFSGKLGTTINVDDSLENICNEVAEIVKVSFPKAFLRVFTWTLPIGQSGFFVTYDLDLILNLDVGGSIVLKSVTESSYKLGVYYNDDKLNSIAENTEYENTYERLVLIGQMTIRIGLRNSLSLNFMQIAKIEFCLEPGVKLDLYGAIQFTEKGDYGKSTGYGDIALYFTVDIVGGLDFFVKDITLGFNLYTYEKKIYEFGNKMLILNFSKENEKELIIDSYDYYLEDLKLVQLDIVSLKIEDISADYTEFIYKDGENFKIVDGKIIVKDGVNKFEENLYITYKNDENLTYVIKLIYDKNNLKKASNVKSYKKKQIYEEFEIIEMPEGKNEIKEDNYVYDNLRLPGLRQFLL